MTLDHEHTKHLLSTCPFLGSDLTYVGKGHSSGWAKGRQTHGQEQEQGDEGCFRGSVESEGGEKGLRASPSSSGST